MKFGDLLALIVGGVIVADILIHPTGAKVAGQTLQGLARTAGNSLLGKAS